MEWNEVVAQFRTGLDNEIMKTPTGERRELLTDVALFLGTLVLYDQEHNPEVTGKPLRLSAGDAPIGFPDDR